MISSRGTGNGFNYEIKFKEELNCYDSKDREKIIQCLSELYLDFENHLFCCVDSDPVETGKLREKYIKNINSFSCYDY